MASKYVYLEEENKVGSGKHTVYPVTDINAIIGFGNKNGDLLTQINNLEKRVKALEDKVNYH